MTADQIRALNAKQIDEISWALPMFEILKEAAAQIAEHNEIQREILQLQKDARAKQEKVEQEMLSRLGQASAETAGAARAGAIAGERTRRH